MDCRTGTNLLQATDAGAFEQQSELTLLSCALLLLELLLLIQVTHTTLL